MKNKFLSAEFQSSVRIIENIMGTIAYCFSFNVSYEQLGKTNVLIYVSKSFKHHIIPERARNYDDPAPYKVRLFIFQIFEGPSIIIFHN